LSHDHDGTIQILYRQVQNRETDSGTVTRPSVRQAIASEIRTPAVMSEEGSRRQNASAGNNEQADAKAGGLGDARDAERADDLAHRPGGENLAQRSVGGA
jgi:hypothetical protein